MNKIYDTAIVGGGIAGFSAALTAKSLKLDYVWFGEKAFGKKTASAEYVRNYPSFTGGGAEFSAALEKQKAAEALQQCGLSPTARAEELKLEEFAALARALLPFDPKNKTEEAADDSSSDL